MAIPSDAKFDPSIVFSQTRELTYRRDQVVPGALGLLYFEEHQWEEANSSFPEADEETTERILASEQSYPALEYLEAVPMGEGRLILPSDDSEDLEVMLFEFQEVKDAVVLGVQSVGVDGHEDFRELADLIARILRRPQEWLKRRHRRRCPIKMWDLSSAGERCPVFRRRRHGRCQ
jgi:hypothetical protein